MHQRTNGILLIRFTSAVTNLFDYFFLYMIRLNCKGLFSRTLSLFLLLRSSPSSPKITNDSFEVVLLGFICQCFASNSINCV